MIPANELKPCPFCGVHGHGNVQLQHRSSLLGWQVLCLSCGSRGPIGDYDDAIERWNHRIGASTNVVESS
ncbi:Lar family restriction alleviation protein [Serratia marcescens]|uniref:Lar family restriction alleviation protein n=1 Tax=Serratia marcescens TaxID=615 RepID=UPI0036F522D3